MLTCRRQTFNPEAYMSPLPECIPMTDLEVGLVTSLLTLGGLIGALASGALSSKYGRLRVMQVNTLFFILGPLAEALAPNVALLALGRFISGLGAGTAVVVVPIYISEIAPPQHKGFFGSFTQIFTCLGIVLTQFLGLFLSRSQLWRAILGTGGIIGFVQLLGLLFAIESPKWIADNTDNLPAAKKRLQHIRGPHYDIRPEVDSWTVPPSAQHTGTGTSAFPFRASTSNPRGPPSGAQHVRLRSLSSTTSHSAPHPDESDSEAESLLDAPSSPASAARARPKLSLLSVWRTPNARPTLLVMAILTIQQFAGINSIVFYGVSLLSSLLASSSATLNLLVACFNLAVTLAAAPLLDRLGRRPCLLASLAGMAAAALALAIAISTGAQPLAALAVFAFVGSFGVGLGPVPFLLASELVAPEAVGAAQSWGLAANWVSTFVVAQFFPVLNSWMGSGRVYYLFAGLGVVFWGFVWAFVPETKGRRGEEEVDG